MQIPLNRLSIYAAMYLLMGLAFPCLTLAANSASDSTALKTKEFILDPVYIDKLYAPNQGPISKQVFNLGDEGDGEHLWVREISLSITDPQGKALPPRYLCHSRAQFVSPENDMPLTLSQGMLDLKLPDGYAARVDNKPKDLMLLAQTMNTDVSAKQTLTYKFTIKYYSDHYAQTHGYKPLRQLQLYVDAKSATDALKGALPACTEGAMCMAGPMFYVPPGHHTYSSQISRQQLFDFTIHFIKLHLHTYGESLSLIDDTIHKTLWKGSGTSDEEGTMLTNTDHYSSTEGIRIDPTHTYRLETTYDNPTNHLIDAMAIIRLYVKDNRPLTHRNRDVESAKLIND